MISFLKKSLIILLVWFSSMYTYAQTQVQSTNNSHANFYLNRGNNAITASVGTAIINGDFPDPLFEFQGQIGYKRFISPFLNVNVMYNKFNLAFKDQSNNGFMSFDLNVEGLLMPNKSFSPFVFAGAGLNASNYFTQSDIKTQFGFGLEYIVSEGIGIKLYSEYNHVFSDLVDGKEFGDADDIYWRIGFGLNYYFRNSKKRKKPITGPTIINSNPIIYNN